METLWRELRYAWRSLARSPGFAFAAILAMAVAIGANTANFSLFDAIVWNAVPVPGFGRLVLLNEFRKTTGYFAGVSGPDFREWQKHAIAFAGLAAFRYAELGGTDNGAAQMVGAAEITPNYFGVLGTKPLLGRSFATDEAEPSNSHVAILSYRYWQSRFAGESGVLGHAIELNHAAYTIVGVMPKDIEYPVVDLFVPLALAPAQSADRGARVLGVLGRLKKGVSAKKARSQLAAIAADLAKAYPETNRGISVYVRPLRVYINGNLTYDWSLTFVVAMGLVLLIACANVANLQLARGVARRKEIALRAALGASRGRMVRQMLVESTLAALIGAGAGLILGYIGIHLIVAGLPSAVGQLVSGWDRIRLNASALAFTAAVAVLAGIVSGVWPAVGSSKPDLVETLKESEHSGSGGRRRAWAQGALVVAQMSLALVLLVGTGLLVHGFGSIEAQQEQFAPANALLFHVALPKTRYKLATDRLALYRQALAKLQALPGAHAATLFTTFPLSNDGAIASRFQVAGTNSGSRTSPPWTDIQSVSPGFFSTLHIPLIAGRDFTSADGPATLRVVIVDRKLAERYWPHASPIGREIRLVRNDKPGPWLTIVGEVGNVLWGWTDRTAEMAAFEPYTQAPRAAAFFALRDGSDPVSLVPAVRREMASIDPDLSLTGYLTREPETLARAIHDSTGPLGVLAGIMAGLGLIAFGLAAVGVYSVMAYAVAQRRHEIGVRMALGADSRSVLGLVLRRSALLLGIGLAIGLPLAYALARLIGGLIFGVSATDPEAFVSAIGVLIGAAFLASYFPARHAARLDPVETLRAE